MNEGQDTVLVTGAAGRLGKSLVESLHAKKPDLYFKFADRKSEDLDKLARETGVFVRDLIAGDMFDPDTEAYAKTCESNAEIVVWNAAINLDDYQPVSERRHLREMQNACLEDRLNQMIKQSGGDMRRLLVLVNSITAIFGDEIPSANVMAEQQGWEYPIMKFQQSEEARKWRPKLAAANVDLSVLYPGSFDSNFTNAQQAFKNANAMGKKIRDYKGRKNLIQKEILDPKKITDSVASMIIDWKDGKGVPTDEEHQRRQDRQEWIILNEDDLVAS